MGASAITAPRNLTIPLLTADDTLAVLGLAQTFSAVKTFSAIPVMSGGAVGFPATQVPSAGANDFDDYEEGTWTPVVGGDATYTARIARYVKIGRLVWLICDLEINVLGTGSATVVSGLPFVAAAASVQAAGGVQYFASIATAVTWIGVYTIANTATASFAGVGAAVAVSTMTAIPISVFQNAARIVFTVVYEATG